ncbi:ribokinase [Georgenia yuyongxinii]|uniref:Ribokinase n=1 Tax=Georgenia yuyongxinii TaxID=2589797 RepID=A0A5B8C8F2_9MICO|nr:ribokinase [Georgenia yuyongxinii]QDC25751.1 ribokinase [Georgenia yuyongxinii]
MEQSQVVVVGSANADLVLDIDHRPAPGETILASDVVTTPGGKGANQAVAAGKVGGRVAFLGCVGDDDHGRLLRGSLEGAGVDATGLRTVAAPTGTAIISVTPDGENSIMVSPGANRHVTPAMLTGLQDVWASAAVVVLQLEIPMESVAAVAAGATGRVVLNAAPAASLPAEVLAVADPLVVNESEAEFLLAEAGAADGATSPDGEGAPGGDSLAARLLALGPRSVILTLGAAGSVIVERAPDGGARPPVWVPARRVAATDTTGAGDAFVGALAVRLAAGASLTEAVELATAVAAVAVTRRGASTSSPTLVEVEAMFGAVV